MPKHLTGFLEEFESTEIVLRVDEEISTEFVDLLTEEGDFALVDVFINDPRKISPQQRKFGYALLQDISMYTGYEPYEAKALMKFQYEAETGFEFSFANSSKLDAVDFLNFLIDFCFGWNIPMRRRDILPQNENQWLYNCIKFHKCAVCGNQGADIHHARNLVGMGGNRKTHDHTKSELIALCRKCHSECHNMGLVRFEELHKIRPIPIDEKLIQKLKI